MGNKTPVPPEVSEREKSPDKVPEREKSPGLPAPKTIRHALTEGTPVTGVSSEEAEMETSPTLTPISATAGTEAAPLPKEVPGTVLPQNVILPRARPQLVWVLLSSLRRDTNPNSTLITVIVTNMPAPQLYTCPNTHAFGSVCMLCV